MASVRKAVREIGRNKRLVVVDGVGYPAVGRRESNPSVVF